MLDTLGLTIGAQCPIDIFNAERHTVSSDIRTDTNLNFVTCGSVVALKTAFRPRGR